MAQLEIRNIRKHFGPIEVLRGVDICADKGEVIAIVGDNGAGKSTLMKIITGVYRPSSGEIRFDGEAIQGGDPAVIRDCGIEMIYQNLELMNQQDVASNIFLGREPTHSFFGAKTGIIDKRAVYRGAEEMISRLSVRLPSIYLKVGKLSGGQQQSVAIARALTFSPKLVIMDEPTAALAVREIEHVLELIRELKRQGITVILISHRLTDIFEVADRVISLYHGVVSADEQIENTSMEQVVAHIVGASDACKALEVE
ncbi:ATP-binding cassette domain-containing protein [Rhodovibrio salinarum]|uniref:Sugar ABC transporter ATP-binding protein n=1 Tax=Rhodovibrio salinarum TaxID=1087 RepID=A0A934UZX9_9PROT|nr:ATP-binding cassette domain-containing protein [Rhodovibrio salinarum]MBK1697213.1 sugar ABC transporter ATP-binding protein [Rhodovibrio salinarum]